MEDKKKLFEDFKAKLEEILAHQEDLELISFDAKLKNGTRFAFNYDEATFDKGKIRRGTYLPVSIFNAVLDIISTLISIALLVISSFTIHQDASFATTLLINTFTCFIVFFCVSAVYHFFDMHSIATKVLAIVRFGFAVLVVALTGETLNRIGYSSLTNLIAIILIAVTSFFFLSLGTKAGTRAAYCCISAIGISFLFATRINPATILLTATTITAGLVPAVLCERDKTSLDRASTNSIFLMGTEALFYLALCAL